MSEDEDVTAAYVDPFVAGYTAGARLTMDWVLATLVMGEGNIRDRLKFLCTILEFDDAYNVHLQPLYNLIALEEGQSVIEFTPDWDEDD